MPLTAFEGIKKDSLRNKKKEKKLRGWNAQRSPLTSHTNKKRKMMKRFNKRSSGPTFHKNKQVMHMRWMITGF